MDEVLVLLGYPRPAASCLREAAGFISGQILSVSGGLTRP